MKLSNTMGYVEKRFGTERAIELYKNAGFESLDYTLNQMTSDENIFNKDNYKERAEYIRTYAGKTGIGFNQTHTPFSFDVKIWNNHYDDIVYPRVLRSLEITAMLGAKIAIVHPIHHMVFSGHEEEIFELNMKYYRGLIPYAREYGIKIAIENMFQADALRKHIVDDTCSRSEEFIRYIDTLDSEYITACLDVGHVGLIMRTDEAEDMVRALGHDRLGALHIHDNNYREDQHFIPGMGLLHWDKITAALGEIDYTGDFTYEAEGTFLKNYDDIFFPTALRFMADVGHHLMGRIESSRPAK